MEKQLSALVDVWALVEKTQPCPVAELVAYLAPQDVRLQKVVYDILVKHPWQKVGEVSCSIDMLIQSLLNVGIRKDLNLERKIRLHVEREHRTLRLALGAELFLETMRMEGVLLTLVWQHWSFAWEAVLSLLPSVEKLKRVFSFQMDMDIAETNVWRQAASSLEKDGVAFAISFGRTDLFSGTGHFEIERAQVPSPRELLVTQLIPESALFDKDAAGVCGSLHDARTTLFSRLELATDAISSGPNSRFEHTIGEKASQLPISQYFPSHRHSPSDCNTCLHPLPTVVEFQTVSFCNASCTICPWPEIKSEQPYSRMSQQVWSRLVDELRVIQPRRVVPYLNNEPLLDRNLGERVIELRNVVPDAIIEVSTNGVLLSLERFEKLAAAGVDEIRVSIFGFDAKSNREIMGTDFNRVTGNLRAIRDSPYRANVTIRIVQVPSPLVSTEKLAQIRQHWQQDGWLVETFGFLSRSGNVTQLTPNLSERNPNLPMSGCELNRHHERAYVLTDGTVIFCCHDWRRVNPMGNILTDSLTDIWRSKQYHAIRSQIDGNIDADKNLICRHCRLARN